MHVNMNFGFFVLICGEVIATVMSEDTALNLESWMNELPMPLKNIPIIYLAIPGSHDSMTYGITRSSGLAPDAQPILHRLYNLFRGTILRWTITQAVDTQHQLLIGIRYFDLRLATKKGDDKLYFTHGLYAEEISKALDEVREFVDSHPGEVVILDCQHFYGFTPQDHQKLIRYLVNLYGTRLAPRRIDPQTLTLNALNRLKQQVIIIYRNESVFSTSEFWPPQTWPSPWPQQDRVSGLITYLRNVRRNPNAGFIHQAVLTPTPTFIVLRWTSNLRAKCAIPVKDEVLPELLNFTPGRPVIGNSGAGITAPVNIVIADFVDMEDAIFPRAIIQLNRKLLKNIDTVYYNGGG